MATALVTRRADDRQLALLTAAREALVRATSVPQVKQIHDVAAAAEIYAKRQQLSEETIGHAHRLKTEASIKLGALLANMAKATGGDAQRTRFHKGTESPATLADLGITKKVAMVAQQLHALPATLQDQVASRKISVVRALVEHRQQTADRPPLPPGKFRVIYADPPWRYGDLTRSSAPKYPTMTIEELCAMDVKARAARDAVLFLWTTAPMLFEAQAVIEAWGFTYKSNIVWDKVRGVFGAYVNIQHEHLLVCTRGSCVPDRRKQLIDSVHRIRKSKIHSEKPAQFRRVIERLYDGPYLELFARHQTPGWVTFGNQVLGGSKEEEVA